MPSSPLKNSIEEDDGIDWRNQTQHSAKQIYFRHGHLIGTDHKRSCVVRMSESEAHVKLWVGNLDSKLTEYQLLKICERFGEVSSFDFLYTITDTGKRYPRGYAFVTYTTASSAEAATKALNGQKVLGRQVAVRPANPRSEPVKTPARPIPPALRAGTGDKLSKEQKAMKIKALEAKLAKMESKGKEDEFKISAVVPSSSSSHKRKPYSR